jgi:hypothetical protein
MYDPWAEEKKCWNYFHATLEQVLSSVGWVGGRAQECVLLRRWCMGGEEDDAKTGALS